MIPSQSCACDRRPLWDSTLSMRDALRRAHVDVVEANNVLRLGAALLEHQAMLAQRQSARGRNPDLRVRTARRSLCLDAVKIRRLAVDRFAAYARAAVFGLLRLLDD